MFRIYSAKIIKKNINSKKTTKKESQVCDT